MKNLPPSGWPYRLACDSVLQLPDLWRRLIKSPPLTQLQPLLHLFSSTQGTLWISWVQPQTQGVAPSPVAFIPLCHIPWHRRPGGTWTPLEGCCSACYRDYCGKGFRGNIIRDRLSFTLRSGGSHWNADSDLLDSRWGWRLYLPWSCQKVLIHGPQQTRKTLETEGVAE